MYCPNPACPDLVKYGVRGEYRQGISICATCASKLVPLSEVVAAPLSETELAEVQAQEVEHKDQRAHGELIVIRSLHTPESAEAARLVLEGREIPSFLADQHLASLAPWYSPAISVRLLVGTSQAQEADRLLRDAGL